MDNTLLAGWVTTRRNRALGVRVTLFRADEAGLDPAGGPWAVVCDAHGTLSSHQTRHLAESFLAAPWDWCQGCRELLATRPRPKVYAVAD